MCACVSENKRASRFLPRTGVALFKARGLTGFRRSVQSAADGKLPSGTVAGLEEADWNKR